MPINGNYVKIGDIELSGPESVDSLISKAKTLYLWKMEAKSIPKTESDIDLEKIFDEKKTPVPENNEFYSI